MQKGIIAIGGMGKKG